MLLIGLCVGGVAESVPDPASRFSNSTRWINCCLLVLVLALALVLLLLGLVVVDVLGVVVTGVDEGDDGKAVGVINAAAAVDTVCCVRLHNAFCTPRLPDDG